MTSIQQILPVVALFDDLPPEDARQHEFALAEQLELELHQGLQDLLVHLNAVGPDNTHP